MIPTPAAGICGIMPLQFAGAFPRRRPDSVGHGSLCLTRSLRYPLRPDGHKNISQKYRWADCSLGFVQADKSAAYTGISVGSAVHFLLDNRTIL